MTTLAPIDRYQQTLPHVRAHACDGQWFLPLDVDPPPAELMPHAELEAHDPRQACLAGVGVLASRAPWTRGRAAPIAWSQLELRLRGIDRHRGRAWSVRDHETMEAVRAQCWRAADLGQRRHVIPVWLSADALIRPTDGELVELGTNPRERRMLEIVWCAYEAAAGGTLLRRNDWAAQLLCSPRSVYNYQRALERRGLVELVQTWTPAPGGQGSRRGEVLMRPGPELLALAASEPLERRRPGVGVPSMPEAVALAVELRRRARRRLYHVSGAHYRRAQWWAARALLNRQPLPDSPLPSGLPQSRSPEGGADKKKETPSYAAARRPGVEPVPSVETSGAPSGPFVASDAPQIGAARGAAQEGAAAIGRAPASAGAGPGPSSDLDRAPSERWRWPSPRS